MGSPQIFVRPFQWLARSLSAEAYLHPQDLGGPGTTSLDPRPPEFPGPEILHKQPLPSGQGLLRYDRAAGSL